MRKRSDKSSPKAVEQARKLVESDEVFLIFASLGIASNAAIQKFAGEKWRFFRAGHRRSRGVGDFSSCGRRS